MLPASPYTLKRRPAAAPTRPVRIHRPAPRLLLPGDVRRLGGVLGLAQVELAEVELRAKVGWSARVDEIWRKGNASSGRVNVASKLAARLLIDRATCTNDLGKDRCDHPVLPVPHAHCPSKRPTCCLLPCHARPPFATPLPRHRPTSSSLPSRMYPSHLPLCPGLLVMAAYRRPCLNWFSSWRSSLADSLRSVKMRWTWFDCLSAGASAEASVVAVGLAPR